MCSNNENPRNCYFRLQYMFPYLIQQPHFIEEETEAKNEK